MRHTSITFIIIITNLIRAFAQTPTQTSYQNLSTQKIYAADLTTQIQDGAYNYLFNDKVVSKYLFDNSEYAWNVLDSCCPCILQLYDENDVLLQELISCRGFEVGWVKEYYPNGIVKMSGQYRENASGKWEHIVETGNCCIREGRWTYFDDKGDTLYNEFWDAGSFINQVPEQSSTEIWSISLTLEGVHYFSEIITFEQVKDFTITTLFKNSHRDSLNLSINFKIVIPGNTTITQSFTLDNFKNIDVQKILNDAKVLPEVYSPDEYLFDVVLGDIKTEYYIEICNNRLVIETFQIFLIP